MASRLVKNLLVNPKNGFEVLRIPWGNMEREPQTILKTDERDIASTLARRINRQIKRLRRKPGFSLYLHKARGGSQDAAGCSINPRARDAAELVQPIFSDH